MLEVTVHCPDCSKKALQVTGSDRYEGVVRALAAVAEERLRQDQLKAEGRFRYTPADSGPTDGEKLAVLAEEFGEVARAVNDWGQTPQSKGGPDADNAHLREELIQTAAVAVAWAEALT